MADKILDLVIDDDITIDGFITYYKFENDENGYRIATFKIDDNQQERSITIVGYFPHFNKTDALSLKGSVIKHRKFGLQVEVHEIIKKLPTSKENIIRFLASSQFKGIGKKVATKIYDFLKDDCINILISNPLIYDTLKENNIINEKQEKVIQEGLASFDFTSNAYQILLKNGFSLKNIMKAEATYKDKLDEIVNSNPYQMILDIDGLGFRSVDKMAMSLGFKEDDPKRVKASILYAISNLANMIGDTYYNLKSIYGELNKIVKIDNDTFNNSLKELINEGLIIQIDDKYFHYKYYQAEVSIAKHLKYYINKKINQVVLKRHFETILKQIQEDEGLIYSNEQKEAIFKALNNGLFIITGGPGTGKTTILKAILNYFKIIYGEDANIALCAPTGRAAKRMSMLASYYACTIHRLLKWDLHANAFTYNASNRLKCDVIIIDEFSMVDTLLFQALLEGTKGVKQIILIGDDNQLPSVGAGNILHDLLKVNEINKVALSFIYRQASDSSIVTLANNIKNNKLDKNFNFKGDVAFVNINSQKVSGAIVNLITSLLDKGYSFDDFQVIIPMYAGVAGIDNINAAIQDYINPKTKDSKEIRINHQVIRENDRVLQLKNQPEDDIYNGDIGVVSSIDLENEEITVTFDIGEVIYPKTLFSNLTLAYAISIHKAQGSEFNLVIMCIFNEFSYMLNKPLIYTGVTRAKKNLVIFGDFLTFLNKCLLENSKIRKTNLYNQIMAIINKNE